MIKKIKIKTEIFRAVRFGMVGGLSTLTYITMVIALSKLTSLDPIAINTLAYVTGFTISATGHSLFSFRLKSGYQQAVAKFFIVSMSGMLFSNAVIFIALKYFDVPIAQALGVAVVPAYSFTLSRLWAFRPKGGFEE